MVEIYRKGQISDEEEKELKVRASNNKNDLQGSEHLGKDTFKIRDINDFYKKLALPTPSWL